MEIEAEKEEPKERNWLNSGLRDESKPQATGLEFWVQQEIKFGKSKFEPWGRRVIRAIDLDDAVALFEAFSKSDNSSVDYKTNSRGYGEYIWSAWYHRHYGDTALHLAFKQKKLSCVYLLLLLNASVDIKNGEGVTAKDLAEAIYDKSITQLEYEARKTLMPMVDPRKYNRLPDDVYKKKKGTFQQVDFTPFRHVHEDAWRLMEAGRSMYSERPASFGYDDIKPAYVAAVNKEKFVAPKAPFKRRFDEATGTWYLFDPITKERIDMTEEEIKHGRWQKVVGKNGDVYYVNELTGKYQEELPKGVKYRLLPAERKQKEKEEAEEKAKAKEATLEDYSWTEKYGNTSSQKATIKSVGFGPKVDEEKEHYDMTVVDEEAEEERLILELKNKRVAAAEREEVDKKAREERHAQGIFTPRPVEPEAVEEVPDVLEGFELGEISDDDLDFLSSKGGKQKKSKAKSRGKAMFNLDGTINMDDWDADKIAEYNAQIEAEQSKPKKLNKSKKQLEKEAAAKAKSDEEARVKKELQGQKRREQRKNELLTGENTSAGAMGTGDVWSKDDITDVTRMVIKQQERYRKMAIAESTRKSGLTLLTAARAKGLSNDIPKTLLQEMDQYKGVKKLAFVKKEDLEDIVRYDNLPAKVTKDKNKNSEGIDVDMNASVLERQRLGIKPTKYDDAFIEYPYRPVTELSTYTNMKMMNVSDAGFAALARVLADDRIIERLCVTNTHITCASVVYLANSMPSIAKLSYLNLSGNAIADIGACAIATALDGCLCLKELNIGYNRIGRKGCHTILMNVLKESSPVDVFSCVHNILAPRQSMELKCIAIQYNTSYIVDEDDIPQSSLPIRSGSSISSESATQTTQVPTGGGAISTTISAAFVAGEEKSSNSTSVKGNKPRFSLFGGGGGGSGSPLFPTTTSMKSTDATMALSYRQTKEKERRQHRFKRITI